MRTVVIADDEPFLRELVRATVESEAYNVIDAADGDEAWAMIQTHRPELVLLDVRMPGRTGLDVVKSIRAEPALAGTRVILLTAKAQPGDVEAGLAAGADFYLTKPFLPADLLSLVEAALGKELI
jgi:CheY-like chemotaxis protein